MEEEKVVLERKLTLFDVTNLVIGAMIGADIFIAASFGANLMGPASLLVWIASGIIILIIALNFAQCVMVSPVVGGPYAYARDAFGKFTGFAVGWAYWLAEWFSLAVFPVAFVRYLEYFIPLTSLEQIMVKVAFVAFLTVTNILGTKVVGRVNDILTIGKLGPLFLFIALGLVHMVSNFSMTIFNLTPFAPLGYSQFGSALILIIWAFAGFEHSTIPANEIENPEKTISKAIVMGVLIVSIFYFAINFIILSVVHWYQLGNISTPLTEAAKIIAGTNPYLMLIASGNNLYQIYLQSVPPPWTVIVTTGIIGVGALLAISGANETGMLGTSRISYAMALDGLFPKHFAKLHPRFKTPYIGLIIQSLTALIASILGNLDTLISSAVFFLALAYLVTCISSPILHKKKFPHQKTHRKNLILAISGAACCVYLLTQIKPMEIIVGLTLLAVGVPIYIILSPKKELFELRAYLSRRQLLRRTWEAEQVFLANMLRYIKQIYRRIRGIKQVWSKTKETY
ncbi:MAG: amino acid permease [Candidatus Jordarchaeaceae archaeon]